MFHCYQEVRAPQGEHSFLVQGPYHNQGFSFYGGIMGFSVRTLLALREPNLEPVFASSGGILQEALAMLLDDQEVDALLALVGGHAGLEVFVVGLDALFDTFYDFLLGLLELIPQAGSPEPGLDCRSVSSTTLHWSLMFFVMLSALWV